MRTKLIRLGGWVAAYGALILVLALAVTWAKRRSEVDSVSDEQKIARSLEIIRTSTPANRKVLKVLFYGQSITASGWHNAVVDHWRQRYPNTVFVVQNRAIGGFSSQILERTTEQDIAAFYPDLIVFHVYGDHRAYERIIRMFRSLTAADIIVQTDHGDVFPAPPCAEGLQLTLQRQQGCAGILWLHQRSWGDEMSYHKIPALAKKYGLALEPQRTWWREYLLREHIEPSSLLVDGLHPNARGKALMAAFFNQFFDNLVDNWRGQTERNVTSIPEPTSGHLRGQEAIVFNGSRIEMLMSKPVITWPAVTIDGGASEELDGCYQVTRTTPTPTAPDWPAIRRITLQHDHTPEEWTVTLNRISLDQKSFDFSVNGSVSGEQGDGNSAENFVAKSGKLRIEAKDWMIEPAFELTHIPITPPFAVRWSVDYDCGNDPEVIDLGNGTTQYRYVVAMGLTNASHQAKLSPPLTGLDGLTEIRIYRPPLEVGGISSIVSAIEMRLR